MKPFTLILGLGLALALAACTSDEATDGPGAAGAGGAGAGAGVTAAPNTVEYFRLVVGDRVFFGTDRSDLDDIARLTLTKQAEWLRTYPATSVTVEGHADERGTREYNLALGERRASAARRFLISQGIEPARIRAVSFGKERPVALCSDESCWSQNRRSVTVVAGAPTS